MNALAEGQISGSKTAVHCSTTVIGRPNPWFHPVALNEGIFFGAKNKSSFFVLHFAWNLHNSAIDIKVVLNHQNLPFISICQKIDGNVGKIVESCG